MPNKRLIPSLSLTVLATQVRIVHAQSARCAANYVPRILAPFTYTRAPVELCDDPSTSLMRALVVLD